MSTPTPVTATPVTTIPSTTLTAPTAVAPPASAPLSTVACTAEEGTAVLKTVAEPTGSPPIVSATSIIAPPEAFERTAELIKELERKRLELETQIKQVRAETAKSSPVKPAEITTASLPETSSSSQRSVMIQTPTSSLASLPALPAALQKLVGSGLNTPDLAHLCEQGHIFRTTHSPLMLERRQVTKDLLPHVFNADPVKVAAFFATPGTPKKMVLTKTSYREGYHSKKENKFICFRHWTRVSPLQAAALSLDNFLVRDLLSHIENDATLRLQAAQQLQEVLNRKEVKPNVENVSSVSSSSSSSSSCMTKVDSPFKGKETKVKAESENKVCHEKVAEAEADLNFYQAPFKALLKAYNDYITQYDTLSSAQKYNEIDRLWGAIAECQRQLPTYGLQEFCNNKPFDPIPSFTTAPHRGACRYYHESLLDLDGIGLKTFLGLYKGGLGARCCLGLACRRGVAAARVCDSAAINRLCELRQAELENIINCLLKPGATITLRPDESTVVKP